jgi:PadR family transcriptional regulator, regulatory protein PadR
MSIETLLEEDILVVLCDGQERYGLEIYDHLYSAPRRGYSTIYPALNGLEARGYITSRGGSVSDGTAAHKKKFYTLTPEGAQALQARLSYLSGKSTSLIPLS